jgi:hypothetical protein
VCVSQQLWAFVRRFTVLWLHVTDLFRQPARASRAVRCTLACMSPHRVLSTRITGVHIGAIGVCVLSVGGSVAVRRFRRARVVSWPLLFAVPYYPNLVPPPSVQRSRARAHTCHTVARAAHTVMPLASRTLGPVGRRTPRDMATPLAHICDGWPSFCGAGTRFLDGARVAGPMLRLLGQPYAVGAC